MRRLVRLLLGLFTSALAFAAIAGAGAENAQCHQRALSALRQLEPAGYKIYESMRDKADFIRWITCDDVQLGLTTAVHESVHMLTTEMDAYPLIDGGRLAIVGPDPALFAPRLLAPRFDSQSTFVSTYLQPGAATSSEEFGYLIDELNAYTHDLNSAVGLASIASREQHVYHRDGLAALMSFVAAYVNEARDRHPRTWRHLTRPTVRTTIAGLWAQAETVMGASCSVPDIGEEAPAFLAGVCSSSYNDGLGQLLGRPPLCPVRCARPKLFSAVR